MRQAIRKMFDDLKSGIENENPDFDEDGFELKKKYKK
jgi:hypothetical protein